MLVGGPSVVVISPNEPEERASRGVGEIRVVEHVVSLHSEGELILLFDREAPLQRHVDIEVAGTAEAVRMRCCPSRSGSELPRPSRGKWRSRSSAGTAYRSNCLRCSSRSKALGTSRSARGVSTSRRVDLRGDLAVGHAEGRAAIDVQLDANVQPAIKPFTTLFGCLEGLAPQHIAGHLVPVVEAEVAVGIAEVERIE